MNSAAWASWQSAQELGDPPTEADMKEAWEEEIRFCDCPTPDYVTGTACERVDDEVYRFEIVRCLRCWQSRCLWHEAEEEGRNRPRRLVAKESPVPDLEYCSKCGNVPGAGEADAIECDCGAWAPSTVAWNKFSREEDDLPRDELSGVGGRATPARG